MNKQIRELWRECVLKHTNDPMNWQTAADEFAELIVRECMHMCDTAQMGYLTHGLEKEASGAISVKQYIEEHFGVE